MPGRIRNGSPNRDATRFGSPDHSDRGPKSPSTDIAHARPNIGRAQIIIGWREPAALPDWGIDSIKTKMDTGARTSAIHVDNIERLPRNRVRFDVIIATEKCDGLQHSVPVETDIVRTSRVRPSNGLREERLVVATRLRLGPVERVIELSLVSRRRMLCRMLLGRTALAGNFLIDPVHPTLLTRPPRSHAGKAVSS